MNDHVEKRPLTLLTAIALCAAYGIFLAALAVQRMRELSQGSVAPAFAYPVTFGRALLAALALAAAALLWRRLLVGVQLAHAVTLIAIAQIMTDLFIAGEVTRGAVLATGWVGCMASIAAAPTRLAVAPLTSRAGWAAEAPAPVELATPPPEFIAVTPRRQALMLLAGSMTFVVLGIAMAGQARPWGGWRPSSSAFVQR